MASSVGSSRWRLWSGYSPGRCWWVFWHCRCWVSVAPPHCSCRFHVAVAIAVASLLFMLVYTGVNVGTGGETIALGMFFTVGVVFGVGYHFTKNLFVPLIGYVVFNGVQILLRAIEVVA